MCKQRIYVFKKLKLRIKDFSNEYIFMTKRPLLLYLLTQKVLFSNTITKLRKFCTLNYCNGWQHCHESGFASTGSKHFRRKFVRKFSPLWLFHFQGRIKKKYNCGPLMIFRRTERAVFCAPGRWEFQMNYHLPRWRLNKARLSMKGNFLGFRLTRNFCVEIRWCIPIISSQ